MASKNAPELRGRIDAAWENLSRQLHGMDAHMERADAPGEWTTREVLSHLLFEPGFDPAAILRTFAERDHPLVEITPGETYLDDQRRQMTLAQLREALEAQRGRVLAFIDGLRSRSSTARRASRSSSSSWAPMRSRSPCTLVPCSTTTGTTMLASSRRSAMR